jgi:hypothetical protein
VVTAGKQKNDRLAAALAGWLGTPGCQTNAAALIDFFQRQVACQCTNYYDLSDSGSLVALNRVGRNRGGTCPRGSDPTADAIILPYLVLEILKQPVYFLPSKQSR